MVKRQKNGSILQSINHEDSDLIQFPPNIKVHRPVLRPSSFVLRSFQLHPSFVLRPSSFGASSSIRPSSFVLRPGTQSQSYPPPSKEGGSSSWSLSRPFRSFTLSLTLFRSITPFPREWNSLPHSSDTLSLVNSLPLYRSKKMVTKRKFVF